MVELPQETWSREATARFRRLRLERQRQVVQTRFLTGMGLIILVMLSILTFHIVG